MKSELGVDTVILSGYCVELCVLSTYRGAEDVDLNPILLRGSLASGDIENIRFVAKIHQINPQGAISDLPTVRPRLWLAACDDLFW